MSTDELLDLDVFSKEHLDRCKLSDKASLKVTKEKLRWGTFGKNGDQPLEWKKLNKCSTNHLNSILVHLNYARFATTRDVLKKVINSILEDR